MSYAAKPHFVLSIAPATEHLPLQYVVAWKDTKYGDDSTVWYCDAARAIQAAERIAKMRKILPKSAHR